MQRLAGIKRGRSVEEDPFVAVEEAAAELKDKGIDDVINKPVEGGRRVKRGGARCAPGSRQRQVIRAILLVALAGAGWTGGPIAVTTIQSAITSVSTMQCSIAAGGAGLKTAICTKYGEILNAINALVYNVSANNALTQLTTFVGGIGVVAAYSTAKEKAIALLSAGGGTFESAVDQLCQLLFDEEGNIVPASKNTKGTQTDEAASGSASGSAAAPPSSTGGRRRKRTMKKRKGMKRSTRKLSFRY